MGHVYLEFTKWLGAQWLGIGFHVVFAEISRQGCGDFAGGAPCIKCNAAACSIEDMEQ